MASIVLRCLPQTHPLGVLSCVPVCAVSPLFFQGHNSSLSRRPYRVHPIPSQSQSPTPKWPGFVCEIVSYLTVDSWSTFELKVMSINMIFARAPILLLLLLLPFGHLSFIFFCQSLYSPALIKKCQRIKL